MGEEVFFAVIAFAGVVVAGVVGLMWGDRRIEQRRAKFVEDGDWAGLFGPLGMAVDRGAEGRSGMRAVGLGGRLEVVLPRDTIAEVEEGMAMRFRLDMSAAVDPSQKPRVVATAPRWVAARGDRASRDVLMRFVGARPDPSAYAAVRPSSRTRSTCARRMVGCRWSRGTPRVVASRRLVSVVG